MDTRQVTITLSMTDYIDLIGNLRVAAGVAATDADRHGGDLYVAAAARVRSEHMTQLAEALILAGIKPTDRKAACAK